MTKILDNDISFKAHTTTGTSSAYILTYPRFILSDESTILVEFHTNCVDNATLNVNGGGALNIKTGSGANVKANDLKTTGRYELTYNAGTTAWIVNEKVDSEISGAITVSDFGDGTDGDVVISVDTNLSRDMFYNNLTINSGKKLDPNGYKIFIKGTLLNNGTINRNGNVGGNGAVSTPGAGGVALNAGSLGAEVGGSNGGGSFGGGAASNGVAGISVNPAYTTTSGNQGGNGAGTGGLGGTATRGDFYKTSPIEQILHLYGGGTLSAYKTSGGAGGGAGGSNNGGIPYGGGGGGNGGCIFISANNINNLGTIESKGGKGGDGANQGNQCGGTGGGAGGNGGVVLLIYKTLTALGTITLTKGAKGLLGTTGGQPGTNGSDGNDGTLIQIAI